MASNDGYVKKLNLSKERIDAKQNFDNADSSTEGLSGPFISDNENINEDGGNENSVKTSNNEVLSIVSDLLGLLPTDTESSRGSSSFNLKGVESIEHLEQEKLKGERYIGPFEVVYTNDYQEFKEDRFPSSKETIFNNAEVNEETNHYNLLATTSLSGSDDIITKQECKEVDNVGHFSNEVETNFEEIFIGSSVKEELSESTREYNLHSKYCEKEFSQEKQRIQAKSMTKRKTEDSFSDFENVMETHNSVSLFNCRLCENKFYSLYHLTVHAKTHSRDKEFKYKSSTRSSSLKMHIGPHTVDKHFQCKLCAYKCTTRVGMKEHMRTHTGNKPFQCEICGYQCTVKGSLKKHMRTHTGDKPFECEICGYKFTLSGSLKSHMRTHTGNKPFQCELCGYKCAERSNIKSHMRTHTGDKPFQCEVCVYQCTVSGSLKKHMRTHTGDKPFQCEICGYNFTTSGSLKNHMRTHTGDKPFQCELCAYKCARRDRMREHMRTHTADKPFQCELCAYKCAEHNHLKQHMRTHTGDKPFQCELCEYKCTVGGSLVVHMRTHTGNKPFKCALCTYTCTLSGNLKKHMRTHTGDKPFKCELCTYRCTVRNSLKVHMRTHTGEMCI